ncbi:MAG: DUF7573 domain-containing protein [Halorubrum sp.]
MGADRSLDEFAGSKVGDGEDGEDEDTHGTEELRDGEDGDEPAEETTPDPAVSTSTWTSGGADCDGCGETVSRRWLDDGAFVCADCKEW